MLLSLGSLQAVTAVSTVPSAAAALWITLVACGRWIGFTLNALT